MQHLKSKLYNDVQNISGNAEAWIEFLVQVNHTNQCLYMIIDCAHDPRIYPALLKTLNTKSCMFTEEKISEAMKAAAPFLVKVKQMDEFMRWCIEEGVHRHWIVFFTSEIVHVTDLTLRLKRFSMAQDPVGKRYFFRFYDARVLPEFLLSSERERAELFRHLQTLWIPKTARDGTACRLEISAKAHSETLL